MAQEAVRKKFGPNTYSTIGDEKENNYALHDQTKEEFIAAVTNGLTAPPQYFSINAKINKEGYDSLDSVLDHGLQPLSVKEFKNLASQDDMILLDTRISTEFADGFIPGSISIGLDGRFAEWAGSLLPFDKPIILITDKGKERESMVRLARVGFNKMQGFLDGGFEAWKNAGEETDLIINIEPDELAMDIPFDERLIIIDVRRETEFADGHIRNAFNIPLNEMNDPARIAMLEENQNLYVHCASGYRSVIAASLLKRQGIHNLRNISGGWDKIKRAGKYQN